ncbi:hypothetical protein FC36_GL001884 [Ligilactobacillus equi DSM 15833 = JCM 10991]|uniref:HTH cro/C1-type domain-containing protein n=1 Tax=Ligilactobacillus equi DSM 15833 = JCM 10991 TaxID=1423740 RepID=A0A0R1T5P5_9LACO|nr:hypothetical protein FC36_GL001884 [Ligilactobacillus equi DSM 15833 = JCM 10991]
MRDEIDSRGIKYSWVAKRMGYSYQQKLTNVLNGRDKFTGDVAIRASKALGVPLEIFLVKS